MSERAKYIVVENAHIEYAVIFSPLMAHDKMAPFDKSTVKGAGFVTITASNQPGKVAIQCYGKSVTLGVASRGKVDAMWIAKSLYLDQYDREMHCDV